MKGLFVFYFCLFLLLVVCDKKVQSYKASNNESRSNQSNQPGRKSLINKLLLVLLNQNEGDRLMRLLPLLIRAEKEVSGKTKRSAEKTFTDKSSKMFRYRLWQRKQKLLKMFFNRKSRSKY